MVNKNLRLKTVSIFVVMVTLLFPSTTLVAEISGVELVNLLSEKDQISHSASYKTSFVMGKNAHPFDPNQGIVILDCEATRTAGSFAMKITYHYEKDIPVFATLGTANYKPFDYDPDGNLIVWRSLEEYVLFAPDRNESIEKIKPFFVDPNGKSVPKGGINTIVRRFAIGSQEGIYRFNQCELATGRGFSKHLGTIDSAKSFPSGLMKVTSQGSYGTGLKGSWELTLDPNSGYLVRKATFTWEGAPEPIVVVTSAGIMSKDGLEFAKYGTFKYSNLLELFVEVSDISKVVGPNKLYEEVRLRLDSPLPAGARIYDLRSKKPVVTTVE